MDSPKDAKHRLLRQQGVLHPHPEAVTAALFQDSNFFDSGDLIQVKYEMLRRVEAEQVPVTQAAHEAGLSRPSFYQAQAAIQQSGLAGLIPQKPGPRGAHKLTAQVLDFLDRQRASQPDLKYAELALLVQEQLDVTVHPRTIERVLFRRQKKRR
jgi:Winged helix-turn helix